MKPVIVFCIILVLFVSLGHGTFAQFMSNLPSEVGHAFEVAWTSITDAIKKPVKTRRLRPGAKRRTIMSRTTVQATTFVTTREPETEEPPFRIEFKKTFPSAFIEITTMPPNMRVRIPLLDKPLFTSVYEWRYMTTPPKYPEPIDYNEESDPEGPVFNEPPTEAPHSYYRKRIPNHILDFGPMMIV